MKREELLRKAELQKARQRISLPIRMQAYERMMLMLERINPENLVYKTLESNMTPRALHVALLKNIRAEFDHNVAQQIYIDENCWILIETSKNEIIRWINLCVAELPADGTVIQLCENIIHTYVNLIPNPLRDSKAALRDELNAML